MSNIIAQIEAEQMTKEIPEFAPGDTVIVQVKVKEGDRQRLQAFEGVCIARRGSGVSETFTVRKISNGVGVERIGHQIPCTGYIADPANRNVTVDL